MPGDTPNSDTMPISIDALPTQRRHVRRWASKGRDLGLGQRASPPHPLYTRCNPSMSPHQTFGSREKQPSSSSPSKLARITRRGQPIPSPSEQPRRHRPEQITRDTPLASPLAKARGTPTQDPGTCKPRGPSRQGSARPLESGGPAIHPLATSRTFPTHGESLVGGGPSLILDGNLCPLALISSHSIPTFAGLAFSLARAMSWLSCKYRRLDEM